MHYRIMDILLVSTPYDTFILEEAGELAERMLGEFRNLDLHYAPALTGVSSGAEALRLARERQIKLIITTPHLPDMDAAELARLVKDEGLDVPVVLLAWDTRELRDFEARADTSAIERTFVWQGDARILVAIVKSVEDSEKRRARHPRRRRAGDPPHRGQRPLLLVLPAGDLHRAAPALSAGGQGGPQPLTADPPDAGPAEDPSLHDLGGGGVDFRPLRGRRPRDHLRRPVSARRSEEPGGGCGLRASRSAPPTPTSRSSSTRRARRTKPWPRASARTSCSRGPRCSCRSSAR